MRFLVLSRNATLYSTSRIVLAGRARGHDVDVVDPLEFQIAVGATRGPSLRVSGRPIPAYDLVLPRIGTSITGYGLAVLRQLELCGVPVQNGGQAIAQSRDKLRSLQILSDARLRVPTTVGVRAPSGVESALAQVGGCPVVVKLLQGTQGIGTMLAETPQALHSLLETLWAMGQDVILQEYVRESKGRDLRAIVVGSRVVAAMRRVAKPGEFRSNLHRGGVAAGVAMKPEHEKTAVKAARLIGLEVAGVDMLEGRRGPRILEVNSSPGLEGIERASGVDVASAIMAHSERSARARASANRGSRNRRRAS